MTYRPWRTAVWLVALAVATPRAFALEPVTREVYLMGTEARLTAIAATREGGLDILDRAIRVLEDAEAELSTWRDSSVVSRINRTPVDTPSAVGPELCIAFADLVRISTESGGAFDAAIGQLTDAWDIHGNGRIPEPRALEAALHASGMHLLKFDEAACTVTRLADVRLDVGAWGKGAALDRVRRALPNATWLIDLGGQVAVNGRPPGRAAWSVHLAHPRHRHQPIVAISLPSGSVSTSAGSERDLSVHGRRIAHHLDPRTGMPARFTGAVVVWHEYAMVADALSTALYVMGPDEGLRWAETHGIAAAFLTTRGRAVHRIATERFLRLQLRPVTAAER